MASTTTAFCSGVSTTALGLSSLKPSHTVGVATIIFPKPGRSSAMVVRAEGQTINPEIRKTEEKVVDSVVVTELSKPLTAYCRLVGSLCFCCVLSFTIIRRFIYVGFLQMLEVRYFPSLRWRTC